MNQPAIYVDEAAHKADWLVQRESRGPGDLENAMRRVASKYDIPFSALWSLRYRKPNDLVTSIFFAIRSAYDAECDRQMRLLQHEIQITKAKAGPSANSVRSAEALVDSIDRRIAAEGEALNG